MSYVFKYISYHPNLRTVRPEFQQPWNSVSSPFFGTFLWVSQSPYLPSTFNASINQDMSNKTGALDHCSFLFPFGNFIIPTDQLTFFQNGWYTTNHTSSSQTSGNFVGSISSPQDGQPIEVEEEYDETAEAPGFYAGMVVTKPWESWLL